MKAAPYKIVDGRYVACAVEEATYVKMKFPTELSELFIPIWLDHQRPSWKWNKDTERPTLAPSILRTCRDFRCHCFVKDGQIEFLGDCSHELAGKNVPMLDVT